MNRAIRDVENLCESIVSETTANEISQQVVVATETVVLVTKFITIEPSIHQQNVVFIIEALSSSCDNLSAVLKYKKFFLEFFKNFLRKM